MLCCAQSGTISRPFTAKKKIVDPVKDAFVKISHGMWGGAVEHDVHDQENKGREKNPQRRARLGSLTNFLRSSFSRSKLQQRNGEPLFGSSFRESLWSAVTEVAAWLGIHDLFVIQTEADVAHGDPSKHSDTICPPQTPSTAHSNRLTDPDNLQTKKTGLARTRSLEMAMPERMFVPYLQSDLKASPVDVITAVVSRVPSELDLVRAKRLRLCNSHTGSQL